MAMEFWTDGAGMPNAFARRAAEVERMGFDGINVVDSQNLAGDCYIALALASKTTERLKLATGVTNPFTRHAAVTACAIATVQAESGGRAMLGIGRGDSALAHLGYAPASVPVFEGYLRRLQGYLRGEEVPFAGGDVDALDLAVRPESSRLTWLRPAQAKVPVDVAATGPKVIAAAARVADRITFALGADLARLRWGMDIARKARRAARLDPEMPFGAYVNVVVGENEEEARRLGEGGLSLFARFSAMHGSVVGPVTEHEREVIQAIHDGYDMKHHAHVGSGQAAILDSEFAREFGIFGPPAYCIARLKELESIGMSRLVIIGPSRGADKALSARAERRFAEEVLPALR